MNVFDILIKPILEMIKDEEKEMDLKIKEVYRVLSDPRRREIYNRLGSEGYRFAENPGDLLQSDIISIKISDFNNQLLIRKNITNFLSIKIGLYTNLNRLHY